MFPLCSLHNAGTTHNPIQDKANPRMGNHNTSHKSTQTTDIAMVDDVTKSELSRFESLPDTILVQIFGQGLLTGPEVARCIVLSRSTAQWFKRSDESRLVWARVLQDEELEGETYEDFSLQMGRWDTYRMHTLSALKSLSYAEGCDIKFLMTKQQKALESMAHRISNFTLRVAGHHSWYKHLPVTAGTTSFRFIVDLTSRMRWDGDENKWVDYVKGDGTEFHYTWMPTEKYRGLYGHFDWNLRDEKYPSETQLATRVGVPSENKEKEYLRIPKSFQCSEVPVTSAVHDSSPGYDLYFGILAEAVEQRDPEFVKGIIPVDCLSRFSHRRYVQDGKLPLTAAIDLEKITKHILKGFPLSSPGSPESMQLGCEIILSAYPDIAEIRDPLQIVKDTFTHTSSGHGVLGMFSTLAVVAQQWREMISMGDSLRDLCLRIYGKTLTPSSDIVRRKIIKQLLNI